MPTLRLFRNGHEIKSDRKITDLFKTKSQVADIKVNFFHDKMHFENIETLSQLKEATLKNYFYCSCFEIDITSEDGEEITLVALKVE